MKSSTVLKATSLFFQRLSLGADQPAMLITVITMGLHLLNMRLSLWQKRNVGPIFIHSFVYCTQQGPYKEMTQGNMKRKHEH